MNEGGPHRVLAGDLAEEPRDASHRGPMPQVVEQRATLENDGRPPTARGRRPRASTAYEQRTYRPRCSHLRRGCPLPCAPFRASIPPPPERCRSWCVPAVRRHDCSLNSSDTGAPVGVLGALRRLWIVASLPLILLVGVALALGLNRAPRFTATTNLMGGRIYVDNPAGVAGVIEATRSLASVYSRAIFASSVREDTARRLGEDGLRDADRLSATQLPDSPLIKLSAESSSARRAVELSDGRLRPRLSSWRTGISGSASSPSTRSSAVRSCSSAICAIRGTCISTRSASLPRPRCCEGNMAGATAAAGRRLRGPAPEPHRCDAASARPADTRGPLYPSFRARRDPRDLARAAGVLLGERLTELSGLRTRATVDPTRRPMA